MQFLIRALTPGPTGGASSNLIQTLTLEALNESEARQQLAQQQIQIISIQPKKTGLAGFGRRPGGDFSLLFFSQELLALLQAGLSVVEAMEALLDQDLKGPHRIVLQRIYVHLQEGLRLSAALEKQGEIFSPLFVGIVQAAERTSDLPAALTRYVDYESRVDGVRNKIISALIYPAILLLLGMGVTVFLIGYVVPRFSAVYQGSGRPIPWLSQVLMDFGQILSNHPQLSLLLFVSGLLAIAAMSYAVVRRSGWLGLLSKIPGLRDQVRLMDLSRLYLTLGMLLEGGIAIMKAFEMVGNSVAPATRQALSLAAAEVANGGSVSQALHKQGLATSITLRLLRVGERSGQLGALLIRSSQYYEAQTSRWIERFSKTFEPVLMTVIGLIIGLIVVLLYMPIFDLAGSLQ